MSRLTLSTSLSLALAAMTACNVHPLKEVQYESSSNTEVSVIEPNRDVDVLFVIDNSGSMAEKQALLAENFEAFVAELDLVDANYRIGVVTTDVGNPRDPEVTVEGGDLRLSSCRDRIDDFNYYGFDAAFACTDHCQRADADLEIRPTETGLVEGIGEAAPRLWLERLYSETNLGGGVSIAEAFGCYGPQGVNGAGFESPDFASSFLQAEANRVAQVIAIRVPVFSGFMSRAPSWSSGSDHSGPVRWSVGLRRGRFVTP